MVRIEDYKGFQLRAAAFHVPVVNRYLSSLLVVRLGASTPESDSSLMTPRCESNDGLFPTESEAVGAAIRFGENVIDHRVSGTAMGPA